MNLLKKKLLENLSCDNQFNGYKHLGFWHAMDIIRDKDILQNL